MSEFMEFSEKVFEKLEYINYPELALMFELDGVARAISHTIAECFKRNLGPTMTACIIYGCTWEYKIIPLAEGAVKH